MKAVKQKQKKVFYMDGITEFAEAMRSENDVKNNELRLKCITALPDSDKKTSLMLEFLGLTERSNVFVKTVKSEDTEEHVGMCVSEGINTKILIVGLVNETKH